MTAFKEIIRKQYIELDDIKDSISAKDFRKYVGVSIDAYDTKLGRIDFALGQSAFKVPNQSLIMPLPQLVSATRVTNKNIDSLYGSNYHNSPANPLWEQKVNQNSAAIYSALGLHDIVNTNYCNCLPYLLGTEIANQGMVTPYPWDGFPSFLYLQEIAINRFEPIIEEKPQNDSRFIRSLKEKYGADWLIIYKKLLGLILLLRILLFIEELIFINQQKLFHNSHFRVSEFEYFDLMFTMKKLIDNATETIVRNPIYSFINIIDYENQGYCSDL